MEHRECSQMILLQDFEKKNCEGFSESTPGGLSERTPGGFPEGVPGVFLKGALGVGAFLERSPGELPEECSKGTSRGFPDGTHPKEQLLEAL